MHVAIIGGGISGIVAAHRLQESHQVTLFEANEYLGGHTNTVDVEVEGQHYAIDTGFIVYNDRTYPRFVELLEEWGVASQPTEMSFSVCDERSGLEYNGHNLNTLFAQRQNLFRPRFYRFLAEILRFNRTAAACLGRLDDSVTVGEFLAEQRFSRAFAEYYLLPMGSAIWSCPMGAFAQFPIRFIIEFYTHHGLLSLRDRPTWRVIRGGSRTYVQAMLACFRGQLRLRTPIRAVRRHADHVIITRSDGGVERFDHAVFACHSDQALSMLGADATPTEREVLGAFPYSRNVALLHTDASILPRVRRAWASWNYRLLKGQATERPACVTYNMNILQGLRAPRTFCVTLNDAAQIDPARVLRQFVYHHPVFTTQRAAAQARHRELLNTRRTSFCGAYWGNGFHEDGVTSALAVVRALRPELAPSAPVLARPPLATTNVPDEPPLRTTAQPTGVRS